MSDIAFIFSLTFVLAMFAINVITIIAWTKERNLWLKERDKWDAERSKLLDRIMATNLQDFKLAARLEHPVETPQLVTDEDEAMMDLIKQMEEERDESESRS